MGIYKHSISSRLDIAHQRFFYDKSLQLVEFNRLPNPLPELFNYLVTPICGKISANANKVILDTLSG